MKPVGLRSLSQILCLSSAWTAHPGKDLWVAALLDGDLLSESGCRREEQPSGVKMPLVAPRGAAFLLIKYILRWEAEKPHNFLALHVKLFFLWYLCFFSFPQPQTFA